MVCTATFRFPVFDEGDHEDIVEKPPNLTKTVTLHDVAVDTNVLAVDDQPGLTDLHPDRREKVLTRLPECEIQMFVFAATVSPSANVKPTSVVPIPISSY